MILMAHESYFQNLLEVSTKNCARTKKGVEGEQTRESVPPCGNVAIQA